MYWEKCISGTARNDSTRVQKVQSYRWIFPAMKHRESTLLVARQAFFCQLKAGVLVIENKMRKAARGIDRIGMLEKSEVTHTPFGESGSENSGCMLPVFLRDPSYCTRQVIAEVSSYSRALFERACTVLLFHLQQDSCRFQGAAATTKECADMSTSRF